jgi:hypothetical protein
VAVSHIAHISRADQSKRGVAWWWFIFNKTPCLIKKRAGFCVYGGIMKKLFVLFLSVTIVLCGICATLPNIAKAETVFVKYRGSVDLSPFDCEWITRSSVVKRLCYDKRERYVIVSLKGTYYHYCEVPPGIVDVWRQADSMGRFYNSQVKGNFDCRVLRVPLYKK